MATLNDKMTALAAGFRQRFGRTDKLSLDDMIQIITPPKVKNLVANTQNDVIIDGNTGYAGYTFAQFDLGQSWKAGDKITVSGDVSDNPYAGTDKTRDIDVVLFDSHISIIYGINQMPIGNSQHITLTFGQEPLDKDDVQLCIYAAERGQTKGHKVTIHHLMVNRGSTAAVWTNDSSVGG